MRAAVLLVFAGVFTAAGLHFSHWYALPAFVCLAYLWGDQQVRYSRGQRDAFAKEIERHTKRPT